MTRIEGMVTTPNSQAPVLGHGYLEAKASTIEIEARLARARHARQRRQRAITGRRIGAARNAGRLPKRALLVIVRTDNGGDMKNSSTPGNDLCPRRPQDARARHHLARHFSGPDIVKKGTLFYVGFGQFTYDTRFDPRPFSISSARSATG